MMDSMVDFGTKEKIYIHSLAEAEVSPKRVTQPKHIKALAGRENPVNERSQNAWKFI